MSTTQQKHTDVALARELWKPETNRKEKQETETKSVTISNGTVMRRANSSEIMSSSEMACHRRTRQKADE